MSLTLNPPTIPPKAAGDDIVELTVRFSLSLPDLLLSISTSNGSNTSTLKEVIRSHLSTDYANRRIRLIFAGKALADDAPLSTTFKRSASRTPSRPATPSLAAADAALSSKAKGKTPLRPNPTDRIYIHCSIGDLTLTTAELAAETSLAHPATSSDTSKSPASQQADSCATTAPAPRGFDRLLTAGFTASEIASLRLQFLSVHSHTHTASDLPSPNTLRELEDQWLDNSNTTATTGAGAGSVGFDETERGQLDDILWGTAMGFFWPIGCLMWAVREEGVWSQRRKMAVVVGVVFNLAVGLVRVTR